MRARRASRPPPLSAFRLFRPRRPRLRSWRRGRGEKACAPAPRCRCAPPLASACRDAGAGVGGRPLRQAPAIPFFSVGGGWLLRGHSAAAAPLAGQSCGHQSGVGGLASAKPRPFGPRRGAPAPPPILGPRGGAFFSFAAAGVDIVAVAAPGHYMLWCFICNTSQYRRPGT